MLLKFGNEINTTAYQREIATRRTGIFQSAPTAATRAFIPLKGQGDRPKAPAVPWKAFQQQPPSESQLADWFDGDRYSAYGIITGAVSRLLVLDFDEPNLYHLFAFSFRELARTFTVTTRRGFHCYFTIPDGHTVPSKSGRGMDILSEGHYVVGPGSVIDGHRYRLINPVAPVQLTDTQIGAVSRFQAMYASSSLITPESNIKRATGHTAPNRGYSVQAFGPDDLSGIYRARAGEAGRNNALFDTALLARDHGWSEADVRSALVGVHVDMPPVGDHPYESKAQRNREARLTIASAFKRPPRPQPDWNIPGLSNRVRETLLAQGHMDVVRTIEALRLRGILPGMGFTTPQAVDLLRGIVGRNSVEDALNKWLKPLQAATPHLAPPNAAARAGRQPTFPCGNVWGTKPGQLKRGRKAHVHTMPTNAEISAYLGVPNSRLSDELALDDLTSSRKTRMALHRGLLLRRPGQYSRAFLAGRLNISDRTLRRYHRADPLFHAHQSIDLFPLHWGNLTLIPPPEMRPHEGVFLQDGAGNRYRAVVPMAKKLLAGKKTVYLAYQQPNLYWYGAYRPLFVTKFKADAEVLLAEREERERRRRSEYVINRKIMARLEREERERDAAHNADDPGVGWRDVSLTPAVSLTPYKKLPDCRKPLPKDGDEAFAQAVWREITAMHERCLDPDGAGEVTLKTARWLVATYGAGAVEMALRRVQGRDNVRKPIGLLATILRGWKKWGIERKAQRK